jgi:hypothetical protein
MVGVPLRQTKADFFRKLGHPVRIRVMELLGDGPMAVKNLLADIGIEPSTVLMAQRWGYRPTSRPYGLKVLPRRTVSGALGRAPCD